MVPKEVIILTGWPFAQSFNKDVAAEAETIVFDVFPQKVRSRCMVKLMLILIPLV